MLTFFYEEESRGSFRHILLQAADKNNDGYISKAEFQKMAKNLTKDQVSKNLKI